VQPVLEARVCCAQGAASIPQRRSETLRWWSRKRSLPRPPGLYQGAAGDLLEQAPAFDEYRGAQVPEGHKSIAFTLTFEARSAP